MLLFKMTRVLCLVLQYPYIPAHITKPKEHKRLYLVQLPEKGECFHFCCENAKVVELVIRSKICVHFPFFLFKRLMFRTGCCKFLLMLFSFDE